MDMSELTDLIPTWSVFQLSVIKPNQSNLANHKSHKKHNDPIQIHAAGAKRGKMRASEARLVLVLLLIG